MRGKIDLSLVPENYSIICILTRNPDIFPGHQSVNKFITRHSTEARATMSLSQTEKECLKSVITRGQSNLTKSASRGAHSPVRGHPRGSKVVPLNSWGRVSY